MKAIRITDPGGPDVLELIDTEIPEPQEGEVLIRVEAAGVNRPDVLQRLGRYPLPPDASPLPGLEVAGTVAATGEFAGRYAEGDRVMALTHGGGYAEYCVAHETHCLPVPETLSMREAACVPETFFTVHYNVFMRAGLGAGEKFLVHGGSSGIGTTAIQLAAAAGARVVTTAGSDEKCAFCRELGAELAVNYRTEDWQKAIADWSGDGVNMILDMVAGDYLPKNIELLAHDGRYSIIAFMNGPTAELDLRHVLSKRLTISGSTLRPQSVADKALIAADVADRVLPLLDDGAVRPVLFESFPLADAGKAHALMETSRHIGKIVLDVGLAA